MENGTSLNEALNQGPFFDPMFRAFVSIGERTGSLDTMFIHLSTFMKREDLHSKTATQEAYRFFISQGATKTMAKEAVANSYPST